MVNEIKLYDLATESSHKMLSYLSSDISDVYMAFFAILIGFFSFSPRFFCAETAVFVDVSNKGKSKIEAVEQCEFSLRGLAGVCVTEWSPGTCRISEKSG